MPKPRDPIAELYERIRAETVKLAPKTPPALPKPNPRITSPAKPNPRISKQAWEPVPGTKLKNYILNPMTGNEDWWYHDNLPPTRCSGRGEGTLLCVLDVGHLGDCKFHHSNQRERENT